MYKHECVICSRLNNLRCIWNIGLLDRFLGNDKVKYCPEYVKIIRRNAKRILKQ